ncbi:acetylcholinesterase-like [Dermacentor silvarum]|uniref:acetylcholinesterase-like n=1 Tax=Dermacentor silvarum TaxID=543639 RepID=UPI002100DF67|nr:acetylcholinesterase-like [Dermacentor silvarum]
MAFISQTSTFYITHRYVFIEAFLVAITLSIVAALAAEETAVVGTAAGSIRGAVRSAAGGKQVYSFTGIPFAKPPLGELRYRKPQPPTPWGDDVLDATKTPPSCMQIDVFSARDLLFVPYGHPKSEDCLFLNVWTPTSNNSTRLPVMAWLHGGGFRSGSAAMHLDDGGNLASLGGIIVVTIAYRLQSFGFLYDGTDDAPGNQGLHDQVLALKWIQQNIQSFGGDPREVTVFGWSAGGTSIVLHMTSTESKDLFKRAIIQSGAINNSEETYMKGIGGYEYKKLRQALADTMGDSIVSCGLMDTARKLAANTDADKAGKGVYFYEIDHVSRCSNIQPWFGMTHGDDVPLVFGRPLDAKNGCHGDIPFSKTIIKIWTDFVKGR